MPNTEYTPAQMAAAIGTIGQAALEAKTGVQLTGNGEFTITPSSGKDGMSSVSGTVNVPNSYSASDEGKVVSNGALVSQSAHATVTQNGTIDTTLNNSVVVNVPTGGGAEQKAVNFIDYDGTILHSYTAQEFASLSAMPENPTHTGLTAQGWNWSLANAKTYVASYGVLWIGQTYIPTDGKTHVRFHLDSVHLKPYLGFGLNGTAVINWGDGSAEETVTGTNASTLIKTPHQYASVGDYEITINVTSGSLGLLGRSALNEGSDLLGDDTETTAAASYYRKHITGIELGSNITSIENSAFYNCYALESITIPNSVTSFGNYVFSNCFELKSITIPNGVTSIGNNTFYGCYELKSITIPNGVTSIGAVVFSNCYSLEGITIPNGVTSIESSIFSNCYALQSITIPNGVTSIGNSAFYGCYTLQNITIPNSVTNIGNNVFQYCNELKSITIPDGVTSIENSAFQYCNELESITIPDSVTSIGNTVFQYCYSLVSVTIPDDVTSIGTQAFANCYELISLKFEPTTPPTVAGSTTFSNLPTDCIIYVPTGTLSAYTGATNYPSSSTYTYVEY